MSVCLVNDLVDAKNKDLLEGDNQKIISGLIISVRNFTRKIRLHLNILCLLLPNVLIQLNEDICRKTCYVLHFVVGLFAYIYGWNYQNPLMPKSQNNFSHRSSPWLVSGLLSSHIYGMYCNVYTVQCNISTDSSLFVWLSRLAKPK